MYSCFHHYCSVCDVDFKSRRALRVHYKHPPIHGDNHGVFNDSDGDLFGVCSFLDIEDSEYGFEDEEELFKEVQRS
ncbi:hypothetical protein H2248_012025 [Termitomyces sp. 'cryptogamus']|nr:hypothetical protein H2248_012025 [Termitomyces sp. 'cryptogamus']